jgi:hypothetical protein
MDSLSHTNPSRKFSIIIPDQTMEFLQQISYKKDDLVKYLGPRCMTIATILGFFR